MPFVADSRNTRGTAYKKTKKKQLEPPT
jgi:hypothetical protein